MSSAKNQPFNKINDKLWSNFLSHLERPSHVRRNTVEGNSILIDTAEATEPTACDENVYTGALHLANDTDNNKDENAENSIIVVLSSDSENENESIWSNNYKSKGFTRLWEKARCLILQRVVRGFPYLKTKDSSRTLENVEDQLFPYERLQELSSAVREYNQANNLNKKELSFLWSNIIQWLTAIKLSTSDPLDLNYDEKYNLIIIDFMIQYINYITKSYCNVKCKDVIQRKINDVIQTMSVIFNGSTSHAIMTLLRIEYKMEYRILLEPILKKYLEDRNLQRTSNDFIVYLRLVFCFKKWKTIIPLKTEREKINEIAIGNISRYQKTDTSIGTEVHGSDNFSILPKSVPKTNVRNQAFASISDLIGFAIKRKDVGTKTLLVYTSLDLDDAITKYFHLYERYITMYINTHTHDPSVMCSKTNIENSRSSLPNTFCQQNFNIGNHLVPQSHHKKLVQHRSPNSFQSLTENSYKKKHLRTVCDINNSSLSESDISFNKETTSKRNINLRIIDIDSTDDDDNEDESSNLSKQKCNDSDLILVSEKPSVDNKIQAVKNTETSLSVSENLINIETSSQMQTGTAPEQRTDKNKEISSIGMEVSSEDDSSKSVHQIHPIRTYSRKTDNTSKVQNEKRIDADLGKERFVSISPSRCRALVKCVATKPTRKEKHCIPGEVSSTTSPDNIVADNTSNDVDEATVVSNSESLEVHSAGGSCQNAREVGTVKVVEQRITPYQPVIINGTFNPGSSILGIDYSNPSSENDDDNDEDANSSNLLSSHYWKVVEEATSSTEVFQRTQCKENVVFSTLPKLQNILTPIEQNLLGPNLCSQNLVHDDVPICSKYLLNNSREIDKQIIEKSTQKAITHNINQKDSDLMGNVNKTINTDNPKEQNASSKRQENNEIDKKINLQSEPISINREVEDISVTTQEIKNSKSILPVILKDSDPQESLNIKEVYDLSLTTLQDKSSLPVILIDSDSQKVLVNEEDATTLEEIKCKLTIPVKEASPKKPLSQKKVKEMPLITLEDKNLKSQAVLVTLNNAAPQKIAIENQVHDISLTTLEDKISEPEVTDILKDSESQKVLVDKNSKSDSDLKKDFANHEFHEISLNTLKEKVNKSEPSLLLKDSDSQKDSSLENSSNIHDLCRIDSQPVLSNEKVNKITDTKVKQPYTTEALRDDLTNNSQIVNNKNKQCAIVSVNKEVKGVKGLAGSLEGYKKHEQPTIIKDSPTGMNKSSDERASVISGEEKKSVKLQSIINDSTIAKEDKNLKSKLQPMKKDIDLQKFGSLEYAESICKTATVHVTCTVDLPLKKNIGQCIENMESSQIEELLREIDENLGKDSRNRGSEQDESNEKHITVEHNQPIEKELTNKTANTNKMETCIISAEEIKNDDGAKAISKTLENEAGSQTKGEKICNDRVSKCLIEDKNDHATLQNEVMSSVTVNKDSSSFGTKHTISKSKEEGIILESEDEIRKEIIENFEEGNNVKAEPENDYLKTSSVTRKDNDDSKACGTQCEILNKNIAYNDKKDVSHKTKNSLISKIGDIGSNVFESKVNNDVASEDINDPTNVFINEDNIGNVCKSDVETFNSSSNNISHSDQSEENEINVVVIKLKTKNDEEPIKGIQSYSKDKSPSIAEIVLKGDSANTSLEITKTNSKGKNTNKVVRIEEPRRACSDSTDIEIINLENNKPEQDILQDTNKMKTYSGSLAKDSNKAIIVGATNNICSNLLIKENELDILQDGKRLEKLSNNGIFIQSSCRVQLTSGSANQISNICPTKDTQMEQKSDSNDNKFNLESATVINDGFNTPIKKLSPEELSDEDVEKRTPWKMRIKRRMSQYSDFGKEFNIESDDNMIKNDISFSSHFAMPADKFHSYQPQGSKNIHITKATDELARNISRLVIRKDMTELHEELRILNESPLNPIRWFKSPVIDFQDGDKNYNIYDEFYLCKQRQQFIKDVAQCEKNSNQSIAVINDENSLNQMPSDYNPEEILAVATLINMRNKFSKVNESRKTFLDITETSTKPKKMISKKVSPSTPPESARLCNLANNVVASEPKSLKSALKINKVSSTLNQKKVRYDEQNLLDLEKEKHLRTTKKFSLKLKTIRSNEGALLKGGNKNIKKRLSAINASFNSIPAVENNGELTTDTKKRRSRNKSEMCSPILNEQNISATDTECLENTLNSASNSVYPVRLTSRRESIVNELKSNHNFKKDEKQSFITKDFKTSNDKICKENAVADSIILPDEKIAGKSEETITNPSESYKISKINIRTISTDDGTRIKIKIKTPEPNKILKDDFRETKDKKITGEKFTYKKNKISKQEFLEKMLTRKAVVKIKRLKLSKSTKISSNSINSSETVESNSLIAPNDRNVEASDDISAGNDDPISNDNMQSKAASEIIPIDKTIVKVESCEENSTLQMEVQNPKNNVSLTEHLDNFRPKKIDHKREIILKSSEFILTEEIVNAQAAQCFKESLYRNLRSTGVSEDTLINRNQGMPSNTLVTKSKTKIISREVVRNQKKQASDKSLSQKTLKLSSESECNTAHTIFNDGLNSKTTAKENITKRKIKIEEIESSEKKLLPQQIKTLENKNIAENSTKTRNLSFKKPLTTDIIEKTDLTGKTTQQLISQQGPLDLEVENSVEKYSLKNKSKKAKMVKEKSQLMEYENNSDIFPLKSKSKKTTASHESNITVIKIKGKFSNEKNEQNNEIETKAKQSSKDKSNTIKMGIGTKSTIIPNETEKFSDIVEKPQLNKSSELLKIENKKNISVLKGKSTNRNTSNESNIRNVAEELIKVQSTDSTQNKTPAQEVLPSLNEENTLKKAKTQKETKTHIQTDKVDNIVSKIKTQQDNYSPQKIILKDDKLCLGNESNAEASRFEIKTKVTKIAKESNTQTAVQGKTISGEEQIEQDNAFVHKTSQRNMLSTEIENNTETSISVCKSKKRKTVKESKAKMKNSNKMENVGENAVSLKQTLPIKHITSTDSTNIDNKSMGENSETIINNEFASIPINKKIEQDINIVANICRDNKINASSVLKTKSRKITFTNEIKPQTTKNELKDICTKVKLHQDKQKAVENVSIPGNIKFKAKPTIIKAAPVSKTQIESDDIFRKEKELNYYDTADENLIKQMQILSFENETSTVANSEKIETVKEFADQISEKEPNIYCKEKVILNEEFTENALSPQDTLSQEDDPTNSTSKIKSKKVATTKESLATTFSDDLKNISENRKRKENYLENSAMETKHKKVDRAEAEKSETLVNEKRKSSSLSTNDTTEHCIIDDAAEVPTQQETLLQHNQNITNTTTINGKEKQKSTKRFENNTLTAELKDESRKRKIEQNNHIPVEITITPQESQSSENENSSGVSESKKIKMAKNIEAQLTRMPEKICSKDKDKCVDKNADDIANKITEVVIAELKLLSPDCMQDENDECPKELNSELVPGKSKQSLLNDSSIQQESDTEERKTAKLLDTSIEIVLGNSKINTKSKVTDNEGKIKGSPVKARLDILTAEKINSSVEKILENKRKLSSTNSSPLTNIRNEFTNENTSCFKYSTKLEEETTKKILSKNALNDVKIISANVPEALFADDESENSNCEDNTSAGEYYAPILSLDDLLIKKDDSITTQPIINNIDNSMETNNRHCLGIPSFTVELEVKTSKSIDNLDTNSLPINKTANSLASKCAEAEELNPNLEVEEAPFSLSDIDDINAIDIPNDLNIANDYPDLLDTILLDQVQQSIDCMISGKNSLSKWSQDSFAIPNEANRSQTEINNRNENSELNIKSDLNVKHAKQISPDENSFLDTINTFEEVEVSTTTGFDLVSTFTMEDFLGSDGDDFFAFSELDKTQSRSNSFSNDSHVSTPSPTPIDNDDEDANATQSHHIKTVACDHSYNKDIKSIQKPETIKNIRTSKPSSPNAIQSLPNVLPNKSVASPNKSPDINIFSKSKCTPRPFWKVRNTNEIKTSTPRKISNSFDEIIPLIDNSEKRINSGSNNDINVSKSVSKDVYNMPVLELGITSLMTNEKKLPNDNTPSRQIDSSVSGLKASLLLTNNGKEIPAENISLKQRDPPTPTKSTMITKIGNIASTSEHSALVNKTGNVSSITTQSTIVNKVGNISSVSEKCAIANGIYNVSAISTQPTMITIVSSASAQSAMVNRVSNVSSTPRKYIMVNKISNVSSVTAQSTSTGKICNISSLQGKSLIVNSNASSVLRQSRIVNSACNVSPIPEKCTMLDKIEKGSVARQSVMINKVSPAPEKSTNIIKVENVSSVPKKSVIGKVDNISSKPTIVSKDGTSLSVSTKSTMGYKVDNDSLSLQSLVVKTTINTSSTSRQPTTVNKVSNISSVSEKPSIANQGCNVSSMPEKSLVLNKTSNIVSSSHQPSIVKKVSNISSIPKQSTIDNTIGSQFTMFNKVSDVSKPSGIEILEEIIIPPITNSLKQTGKREHLVMDSTNQLKPPIKCGTLKNKEDNALPSSKDECPTEVAKPIANSNSTIISQPIIRIQSQTNRLERIDPNISEPPDLPNLDTINTTNTHPSRESTPTMDEISKDEDVFASEMYVATAGSSVQAGSKRLLKPESNTQFELSPEKKVCIEKKEEKLSTNDLFDILKREEPVSKAVSKPPEIVKETKSLITPIKAERNTSGIKKSILQSNDASDNEISKEIAKINHSCHKLDNNTISLQSNPIDKISEGKGCILDIEISPTSNICNKISTISDTTDKNILSINAVKHIKENIFNTSAETISAYKNDIKISALQVSEDEKNSIPITVSKEDETIKARIPISAHQVNESIKTAISLSSHKLDKACKIPHVTSLDHVDNPSTSAEISIKTPLKPSLPDMSHSINSPELNKIACNKTSTVINKNQISKSLTKDIEKTESVSKQSSVGLPRSARLVQTALTASKAIVPSSLDSLPTTKINTLKSHSLAGSTNSGAARKFSYYQKQQLTNNHKIKFDNPTISSNKINKIFDQSSRINTKIQQNNSIKPSTSDDTIKITDTELSHAEKATIKAKVEEYRLTLEEPKTYGQHRIQQQNIKNEEDKIRRGYLLERQKRRIAEKQKQDAQRLKRRSSNPEPQHSSTHAIKSNRPHHHRQKYVNKFSEIEKRLKVKTLNSAPLTVPTAWEPKPTSFDEIIAQLTTMKKHAPN